MRMPVTLHYDNHVMRKTYHSPVVVNFAVLWQYKKGQRVAVPPDPFAF